MIYNLARYCIDNNNMDLRFQNDYIGHANIIWLSPVLRFFFCYYRSGLPLSTHQPVTTKNTGKYDSIGDKNKKACVRIKRVKSDNNTSPPKKNTNKLICFMKM